MHKNTEIPHNQPEDQARAELARREWTDPARVAQWAAEWPQHRRQTAAATSAMVNALAPEPGQRILDIATGTGDPGLTLARRVAPGGRVTCADLSSGMLAAARENARAEGLDNVDFVIAGGDALPFLDESFDAVSCRFGIMFILDAPGALREMRRVLVAGGRAALMVWGSDRQPFWDDGRGTLLRHWKVIPAVRQPLTPWRFQQQGELAALASEAGFRDVNEVRLQLPWPSGTVEGRLDYMREQWKAEFEKMPAETARTILEEMRARFSSRLVGGELAYTVEVWLVSAIR